jgi:hypothetical protein
MFSILPGRSGAGVGLVRRLGHVCLGGVATLLFVLIAYFVLEVALGQQEKAMGWMYHPYMTGVPIVLALLFSGVAALWVLLRRNR